MLIFARVILLLIVTTLAPSFIFGSYSDALSYYYQGRYEEAAIALDGVQHPNRELLLSLIQLRLDRPEARLTFSNATIPKIGTFERVLKLWFAPTSDIALLARSTAALGASDRAAFVEPANLELGRAYFQAGELEEALEILKKLASAKDSVVRRDANKLEVITFIRLNRKQAAQTAYQRLLTTFPTADQGFEILKQFNTQFGTGYGALDILGSKSLQLTYIMGLFSRKSFYDHRIMTEAYLKQNPKGQSVDQQRANIVIGYFEQANYEKAELEAAALLSDPEFLGGPPRETVQFYWARSLHRQKKFDLASAGYKKYLSSYPNGEYAPSVYYYLYWVLSELGQLDAYQPYLADFKVRYPNTLFFDKLMWELGWSAYIKRDYQTAFDILSKSDWKFDPDASAKVSFWVAKVSESILPSESQNWFLKVIRQHPFTYYGYRVAITMFPNQIEGLARRFESTSMPVDPIYKIMLEAGLGDMAAADLDYRINKLKDRNSKTILTLAYLYNGMLQNHRAIGLLTNLGFTINPKDPKISKEIAQLLYPRPHWPLVQRYSAEYGVDPYLVIALMREESLFNHNARSRVGAMGLMQIMPSTGQGIAKNLRVEWSGPEMLAKPEVNIRFGVYYVSTLQKRFNNNPILMLSGYNAGPNATRRWVDRHGDRDMDIFVANIPYSETHFYVTRVLKSYWVYRLLYDPQFGVGEK